MLKQLLHFLIIGFMCAPFANASDECPATVIDSLPFYDYLDMCGSTFDYAFGVGYCDTMFHDYIYTFTPEITGTYAIMIVNRHFDPSSPEFIAATVATGGACPGDSLVTEGCLTGEEYLAWAFGPLNSGQEYFVKIGQRNPCSPVAFLFNRYQGIEGCAAEYSESGLEFMLSDSLNAYYDINGGCAMQEIHANFHWMDPLAFGATTCGRLFRYPIWIDSFADSAADVDQFLCGSGVPRENNFVITFQSEFSALVTYGNYADCDAPSGFFTTQPNVPVTHVSNCINYGSIFVRVESLDFDELGWANPPEPHFYTIRVDTIRCADCNIVDEIRAAPTSFYFDNTCSEPNDCGQFPSRNLTAQIYIPEQGWWTFDLCGSVPTWQAVLTLSESCCGPMIAQGAGGCPDGMAAIDGVFLDQGVYFVGVEGLNIDDCGNASLNIEQLLGRCCYGSESAPSCADVRWSECQTLGGVFNVDQSCAGEPCPVRPLCDREGGISQPPHVPAESYSFEATIAYWDSIDGTYDHYNLSEPVAVAQFWARRTATGSNCIESETAVRLSFHATPEAPATCSYDLNLAGVLLPFSYGPRDVYEFTAVLPELCELTSGFVRVESLTDTCSLLWLSSPFGDGESERYLFGLPTTLAYDMSLCLSGTPEVVINEVMYDDTANSDIEWVELHNTRNVQIDVSNWILSDGGTWPPPSTEGAIQIPSGTTIAPNGYLVISKLALPGIPSVVCTEIDASWALANGGDNLALYRDTTSSSLVDGALNLSHPDLAPGNTGTSVEKCMEDVAWTNDTTVWSASTHAFSPTGRYRFCTPGARNSCVTVEPCLPPDSVTVRWNPPGNLNIRFVSDGGTYEIYSTNVINNDGDPRGGDPQWSLRRTANFPAGPAQWTDPSVSDAYRNYVVLKVCP